MYPPNVCIVKGHFADDHPVFRGFPNLVPDLEIDLFGHPVVKGRNSKGGHVVPFYRVVVFRGGVREFLNKGEEVNPSSGFSQRAQGQLRVLEELVSLSVDEPNSDQLSVNPDFLAADFQTSPASLAFVVKRHQQ